MYIIPSLSMLTTRPIKLLLFAGLGSTKGLMFDSLISSLFSVGRSFSSSSSEEITGESLILTGLVESQF